MGIHISIALLTLWSSVLLDEVPVCQLVKEFPRTLRKPNFHFRIHKYPPPVLILSQINPFYAFISHFLKMYLNIIFQFMLGSSNWSLSLRFPHKSPVYTTPLPIRATCLAHPTLDLITRTILGEAYRSLSSSLCSFLHSPVTSSLLGPNILLSALFSNTLRLRASRSVDDQVSHPYKQQAELYFCIY